MRERGSVVRTYFFIDAVDSSTSFSIVGAPDVVLAIGVEDSGVELTGGGPDGGMRFDALRADNSQSALPMEAGGGAAAGGFDRSCARELGCGGGGCMTWGVGVLFGLN